MAAASSVAPSAKRTKKRTTLKTKLEIIQRKSGGESAAALARAYKVNESSIRTICKSADKIKKSVAHSTPLAAKIASRVRNPLMVKMELALADWIRERELVSETPTANVIRERALAVYNELSAESEDTSEPFLASKGWLENFKRRLRQLNSATASNNPFGDPISTSAFIQELKSTVATEDYTPQQIFNIHETILFWKRLPEKTYLSNSSSIDLKPANDRVTLMLCNNADGSFKCKPLVVYHSDYPQALKGKSQHTLPVNWRSNKKARITGKIFEDWFINCFCIELERHCRNSNVIFKGLLLLDTGPLYPSHLPDLHPNVKIVFLPGNISSGLISIHREIISFFKLYYLRQIFSQIVDTVTDAEDSNVYEFLKNYDILHAIGNISYAWDQMQDSNVNTIWKILFDGGAYYPDEFSGYINTYEMNDVINLGKSIGECGFEDLEVADVARLIDSKEDFCSDDPLYLSSDNEGSESGEDVEPQMSLETLRRFFTLAEQLSNDAMNMDPNMERSIQFGKSVASALSVYKDIYKEKLRKMMHGYNRSDSSAM